jgi:hypothetical protein
VALKRGCSSAGTFWALARNPRFKQWESTNGHAMMRDSSQNAWRVSRAHSALAFASLYMLTAGIGEQSKPVAYRNRTRDPCLTSLDCPGKPVSPLTRPAPMALCKSHFALNVQSCPIHTSRVDWEHSTINKIVIRIGFLSFCNFAPLANSSLRQPYHAHAKSPYYPRATFLVPRNPTSHSTAIS